MEIGQAEARSSSEHREKKKSWLLYVLECICYGAELFAWVVFGIVRLVTLLVVGILGSCS